MSLSNESMKQYAGMPAMAPMPDHPIGAAPREAVPMPSAMPQSAPEGPDTDAGGMPPPTGELIGGAPEAVAIALPDYPGGRGGMSTVPLPGGDKQGPGNPLRAGTPISGRPPASEMPDGPPG